MDDSVDDSNYPSKTCSVHDQQNYGSSLRFRPPLHSDVHSRTTIHHFSSDEEENYGDDDDDSDDDSDDDEEKIDDDDTVNVGIVRHRKKRKLNDLISKYEFAPRLPDWTDGETFALLNVWGDLYIKRGRKSLDPEEWQELVEKLSHDTNINRSETQCRDRLEGLEKKYKKEKSKLASKDGFGTSDWMFYKKMDIIMYSPLCSKTSLPCGVDSGEYVFMDPKVYLDRANGLDEMRDSPTNSNDDDDDDDEDDDGMLTMLKRDEIRRENRCIGLLADSIEKVGEIYEKVEVSKGKEMAELENMRVDVQRQVETQRRQILERARIEIARIRDDDDDDDDDENDVSNEDLSR